MEISPLGANLGAEIIGLDLSRPLDNETRNRINRAFVYNIVLCFRAQSFSTPDDFVTAAKNLGDPMPPLVPTYILPGQTVVEELSNKATDKRTNHTKPMRRGGSWHSDHSNLRQPPKATTLYGIEIPEDGGNTEFTNMHAAYDALSDEEKDFFRGRRILHQYISTRAPRRLLQRNKAETDASPDIWQPLVRQHDETGRKSLFLNPMRNDLIEGLDQAESFAKLDALFAHCDQPRFQYSHKWRKGDMLIWDNRSAMHQATFNFDQSKTRYLHRIMLKGSTPILADA